MRVATLFTIGHSTRTFDELVEALRAHDIRTLLDIRAFPMSRRLPHFNRESLEKSLPDAAVEYVWIKALGGYRKQTLTDSPNIALRNASFRNYADYMLTPEFAAAAEALVPLAARAPTAYMCAERMWFQCHRMLLSDWLVAHGHTVLHIDGTGQAKSHHVMQEARLVDGQLLYRGNVLF